MEESAKQRRGGIAMKRGRGEIQSGVQVRERNDLVERCRRLRAGEERGGPLGPFGDGSKQTSTVASPLSRAVSSPGK